MTSFIITSPDKKKREFYLQEFLKTQKIDTFDRTFLALENSVKQNTQSIGIEDIKHMQKKLFLKPIKSKNKAVIIEEANLLTHEAQNALLKVLEEPPANTLIILATDSKESLLPTIISRCQIIALETEQQKISEKERAEIEIFIENLETLSVGEKLKKAEQLAKDKDKATAWVGKVIVLAREKLLKNYSSDGNSNVIPDLIRNPEIDSRAGRNVSILKSFQSLYALLKTTNVNARMAIETTFLNL